MKPPPVSKQYPKRLLQKVRSLILHPMLAFFGTSYQHGWRVWTCYEPLWGRGANINGRLQSRVRVPTDRRNCSSSIRGKKIKSGWVRNCCHPLWFDRLLRLFWCGVVLALSLSLLCSSLGRAQRSRDGLMESCTCRCHCGPPFLLHCLPRLGTPNTALHCFVGRDMAVMDSCLWCLCVEPGCYCCGGRLNPHLPRQYSLQTRTPCIVTAVASVTVWRVHCVGICALFFCANTASNYIPPWWHFQPISEEKAQLQTDNHMRSEEVDEIEQMYIPPEEPG